MKEPEPPPRQMQKSRVDQQPGDDKTGAGTSGLIGSEGSPLGYKEIETLEM